MNRAVARGVLAGVGVTAPPNTPSRYGPRSTYSIDEAAAKVEHEKREKDEAFVTQQHEKKLKFDKAFL